VHFRFESRHIDISTGNELLLYCNVLAGMFISRNNKKPHHNSSMFNILVKHFVDIEFYVKFQPIIHFPATILDFWEGLREKYFRHFVDNSYLGKVYKAFPEISSGYGTEAKMLNLGYFNPRLSYPL
jgi:hypothetical protein